MTNLNFLESHTIDGVILKKLKAYHDERGHLTEFFRHDEIEKKSHPVMGYISVTNPGFTRGPHEHVTQTDIFVFLGPGDFLLALWDNRPSSPTYRHRLLVEVGSNNPMSTIIPEGVVHAYRCISKQPGTVINVPNQLYAGEGKKHPVDEVRHESDPNSPFVLDLHQVIRDRKL